MAVVSPDDRIGPRIHDEQTFLQEFLGDTERNPSDVRVYVVGDEIVGAMRRHAPDGEWRTNVALGAEVEGVTDELGAVPGRIARKAASVLDLDLAGVDLMAVDGEWYVLEVNATAGFKGLYSATGVSVAPYIARLAIERAGGTVPESEITAIHGTLDDSVPECKPPLDRQGNGAEVIGYTTRVQIAGSGGAEEVVAKSDTGAKRTSIDTELAGRIGAGPLVGTTQVRTGAGSTPETRPLVDVELGLRGGWRTVTASLADRSEMTYPVILGRDVLEGYTLDVSQRVEE